MVNSASEKSSPNGELSAVCGAPLTDSEKEVLHMITSDFASPKEITIRRKTKKGITYKIIRNLKQKGALNIGKQAVNSEQSSSSPSSPNQIRLHAQEFNIRILFKDEKYRNLQEKGNVITIDGNTIRLFENAIEVYSGHSFYADDVNKATAKSMVYWQRLFARLENDFKVILVKPRALNIKLVNAHYAEVNNELARQVNATDDKIKIYALDDGKLWFTIDNSFNLHEAETLHPKTSKQDMGEIVKPFFQDLRQNRPPLPSDIWKVIAATTQQNHEIALSMNFFSQVLKAQMPQEQPKEDPDQKRLQNYFG